MDATVDEDLEDTGLGKKGGGILRSHQKKFFGTIPYFLELLTESVFFGRYRSVFLGIYHTDTEGKLGQYFRYCRYKKVRIYCKMTSARRTTALAPKKVFAFLAESGTEISFRQHYDPQQDPPPPPHSA